MTRRLDLSDIQGNVLRGFGLRRGWHQFVRIDDAAAGRAWLGELVERVSKAQDMTPSPSPSPSPARRSRRALPPSKPPKPPTGVNIALSATGLVALGLPRPLLAGFSPEFRKGMAAQAEVLGDHGSSDPGKWRSAFLRGEKNLPPALAIVSVYAEDDDRLRPLVDRLRNEVDRPGLVEVHHLPVQRPDDNREHFGFADGFAQPTVAGAPRKAQPGRATSGQLKALPAGEFLLGHRDAEYAIAPGPPGPLGRNGTYMVYRELAQDVAAFRHYLDQQAKRWDLTSTAVAAKMIGRWPNGLPLVVTPDEPDPAVTLDRNDPRLNDFGYRSDPDGTRCPLGAHIRRVNPRDGMDFGNGLDFGDRLSRRHRMIRRGMTYGPPFEEAPEQERGLAFICFVASIRRQFEFVQAQWCNDGNAFGIGVECDALIGREVPGADHGEPAKMTVPGTPARFLSPLPDVVRTAGGEYFFLPSLQGLRALAGGNPGG
jgi:Dyp-type peroxidase family